MIHPILSSHPAVVAIEEKIRDLDRAEASRRKHTREARADYEAAIGKWRESKAGALLAGEPPPPEPAPPAEGGPDEGRFFLDQRQAHRAQRRDLLAQLAPEVEDAARARMEKIVDETRPLIDKLQSLADESGQLVAAVRACLVPKERAENIPAGQGRGDRMRHGVEVGDLVAAILESGDLLAPVTPEPPRMIAASFEPPEEPQPATPSAGRDRTPMAIQRKG